MAYWHSWYPEYNPDKNVGSVLMPVLEGILSVPFGSRFPGEQDGVNLHYVELCTQEDCWDAMDNCLMYGKREAANVWEEAAVISGLMGSHDEEDC